MLPTSESPLLRRKISAGDNSSTRGFRAHHRGRGRGTHRGRSAFHGNANRGHHPGDPQSPRGRRGDDSAQTGSRSEGKFDEGGVKRCLVHRTGRHAPSPEGICPKSAGKPRIRPVHLLWNEISEEQTKALQNQGGTPQTRANLLDHLACLHKIVADYQPFVIQRDELLLYIVDTGLASASDRPVNYGLSLSRIATI